MKTSTTLNFYGAIDIFSASDYQKDIDKIEKNGTIILDLQQVTYMCSAFVGFLLRFKQLTDREGGVLIIKPSIIITKLFTQLGIVEYFEN